MASKKYSLLTGAMCLLASYGFSQTTGGTTTGNVGAYDVSDSSVIPSKRMPQHTEFMNGTYNYPAKPRNQWELGVKGGLFTVSSDVPAQLSWGAGVHVRKALGYVFSLRLNYMYAKGKGLSYVPATTGYKNNPAWTSNGYTAPTDQVFYNFKTTVQDLSLEGIFSLNNVRFHKSKTGVNFYALIGAGAMIYDAFVNAVNDEGGGGNYAGLWNGINATGGYKDRGEIRDQLKDGMDDSYETAAENEGNRRPKLFGQTLRPVGHVGVGVAFKLGKSINLALEDRFSFTKDDLLDGVRWQEHPAVDPALTRDFDLYNFASLGLNFNIGSKSVEPLWWVNPLDYAYSEIRNPRLMRIPKPVLPDTDGDGVTDQFDQEQTPAGCPVDTHGVSRDTDGDGVPDCRDKEVVTPTYCQPVDADGVGKCPCPEGCGKDTSNVCATALGALPSVTFSGNSVALSSDANSMLASVASRMRNNPECRVVVTGYCASSKSEQQRSWDRVNSIINYMVEKEGISADRFYFNYGQEGGDCNTVDLRAANPDEQGQTSVPAPHPNLRKSK
jgi:outer membrane protein OmpA-like peptidoglycan-associated protein